MDPTEKHKPLSLLLVDDDIELCGTMKEFFAEAGHHLECAHNGRDGLYCVFNGVHNIVILNVILPVIDGLTVLRQMRRCNNLPVIMLCERVQRYERIMSLNAGADSYLPKPLHPDELLAHIRAILRRSDTAEVSSILTIDVIQVNPATREAWVAGTPIDLTPLEFDLLEMLMRSAGHVVSRDEITAALFERKANPYDRFLDVHVSHLRKKLDGGPKLIRAVRGVGYVYTGAN